MQKYKKKEQISLPIIRYFSKIYIIKNLKIFLDWYAICIRFLCNFAVVTKKRALVFIYLKMSVIYFFYYIN